MDERISFIRKEKGSYKVNIISGDEEYKFNITEDLLIESRFLSLRKLTDEEYKAFLSKLPYDSLLLNSVKYLDKRVKSEKEMREHLSTLTSSDTLIDKVIEELKKKKLLNDEVYKSTLLEELIYYKRNGRNQVYEKLREAGLNENFLYPYDALKENIDKLTLDFDKKNHSLSYQNKILKLKIYLLRKGYSEEDISANLNYHLLSKENEEENLEKDFMKLSKRFDDKERITAELLKKGYSMKLLENMWRTHD